MRAEALRTDFTGGVDFFLAVGEEVHVGAAHQSQVAMDGVELVFSVLGQDMKVVNVLGDQNRLLALLGQRQEALVD